MNRSGPYSGKEARLFLLGVMIPTVAAFLAIRLIPMIQTLVFSLFNWNLIDGLGSFVFLKNYLAVLQDNLFYESFKNTLVFAVSVTVLNVVLGLTFGLLIHHASRSSLYETIIFVPVVLTYVPVCLVWLWLLNWDGGIVNIVLERIGVGRVPWMGNKSMTMVSIIMVSVWKMIGYYMVIFYVGLKNIPPMYYEVARLDGASSFRTFRSITLPLLKPIMLFVLVIAAISNIKVFTQVYAMTHGQAGQGTHISVLVYDIYTRAFVYFKMGRAAAESIILLLIVLVVTLVQFGLLRGKTDE